MFDRRKLFIVGALAALMPSYLTGAEPLRRPTAAAEVWSRTELYFGTNRNGELPVTDAEFNGFLEVEVTPRFPDGLTLLRGDGQFRTSTGALVRERSYVLVLLYPPQMRDANQRIQEIRDLYKRAFRQESVLRVDSFSFVSF